MNKQKNEQVEQILAKESQWQDCYKFLRNLILMKLNLKKIINGCILVIR